VGRVVDPFRAGMPVGVARRPTAHRWPAYLPLRYALDLSRQVRPARPVVVTHPAVKMAAKAGIASSRKGFARRVHVDWLPNYAIMLGRARAGARVGPPAALLAQGCSQPLGLQRNHNVLPTICSAEPDISGPRPGPRWAALRVASFCFG